MAEYLAQLTGQSAAVSKLSQDATVVDQFRKLLHARKPILVGTKSEAGWRDAGVEELAQRLKLVHLHAYHVVEVTSDNKVRLSNPHGDESAPELIDLENLRKVLRDSYAHLELSSQPMPEETLSALTADSAQDSDDSDLGQHGGADKPLWSFVSDLPIWRAPKFNAPSRRRGPLAGPAGMVGLDAHGIDGLSPVETARRYRIVDYLSITTGVVNVADAVRRLQLA
jgi:hypothetical protein